MRNIPIVIALSFFFVSILSCKSSSKILQDEHPMTIMLKDSLTEVYLSKTYKTFQPNKVKPSNKTLNQYRAIFTCSEEEKGKLMLLLSNDPNVLSVIQEEENGPQVQSSTSGKAVKVKPGSSKR